MGVFEFFSFLDKCCKDAKHKCQECQIMKSYHKLFGFYEGEFLDCIELKTYDLDGLVETIKDMADTRSSDEKVNYMLELEW